MAARVPLMNSNRLSCRVAAQSVWYEHEEGLSARVGHRTTPHEERNR